MIVSPEKEATPELFVVAVAKPNTPEPDWMVKVTTAEETELLLASVTVADTLLAKAPPLANVAGTLASVKWAGAPLVNWIDEVAEAGVALKVKV